MKKIIVLTGVLVTLCLSTLNAQTKAQNASFSRKFSDASHVRWEKITSDISLVRFAQSDENSIAYFGKSGDLLASGKQIELSQSPESVQKRLAALATSLEKKEGTLRVIHVYQIAQQSATKYYANMGNENVLIAVMVASRGKANVIKRSELDPTGIEGPVLASFK